MKGSLNRSKYLEFCKSLQIYEIELGLSQSPWFQIKKVLIRLKSLVEQNYKKFSMYSENT